MYIKNFYIEDFTFHIHLVGNVNRKIRNQLHLLFFQIIFCRCNSRKIINTNILLHFIMPQILLNLTDYENSIATIVKGKYNFRNKNEAIRYMIREYEIEFLEPELKPEFIERMEKVQKEQDFMLIDNFL